jgi:hypothetical protein
VRELAQDTLAASPKRLNLITEGTRQERIPQEVAEHQHTYTPSIAETAGKQGRPKGYLQKGAASSGGWDVAGRAEVGDAGAAVDASVLHSRRSLPSHSHP